MISLVCGLLSFVPTIGWAFIAGAQRPVPEIEGAGQATGCLRNAGVLLALAGIIVQLYLRS
jgi:hypothetical protein